VWFGMLITIGCWLVLFAILFGVGCFALLTAGRKIEDAESVFTAFWLGWALTIAFLQIWNLFAPIDSICFGWVALLGSAGIVRNKSALVTAATTLRNKFAARPFSVLLWVCASALFILWLSNRAMGPITPKGDAGLYHITTIRWLQNYPVIPGLGNLLWAHNNSSFLFLAMLDLLPGPPHFYHLGNPLLIIVFSAQACMYLWQVARQRERVQGHRVLGCLWLAGIVPYFFMEFSSTSTDIVNLMLGLILGIHLFKIVFQPLSLAELGFQTTLVVLFTAIGISNKLSFVFLGCPASLVAVLQFTHRAVDGRYREALKRLKCYRSPALLTLLLTLAILVPWVIRGVISSGYIAYPSSTALHLDVDWRVPEEVLNSEYKYIRVVARTPHLKGARTSIDAVLDGWAWFVPWLKTTALRADIFTVPLVLFGVMAAAYGIRQRSHRQDIGAALVFLAPPALAFVLWFLTVPAERFGGGIFWLLGAGMTAIYFQQAPSDSARRRIVTFSLSFIAITAAVAIVASASFSMQRYGWAVFVRPGPEQGFHPIPEVEVADFTTQSGFKLNQPKRVRSHSSKWVPEAFCWDAPLPCSPRPKKELELRRPGDLSGGFRLRQRSSG